MHLLPCTINYDGEAKVSTFFVVAEEHKTPPEATPVPRLVEKTINETPEEAVAASGPAGAEAASGTSDPDKASGIPEVPEKSDFEENGANRGASSASSAFDTQDSGYLSAGAGTPKPDEEDGSRDAAENTKAVTSATKNDSDSMLNSSSLPRGLFLSALQKGARSNGTSPYRISRPKTHS